MATRTLGFPATTAAFRSERNPCVGQIVEVTEDGRPIVEFDGAPGGRILARVAAPDPGSKIGGHWKDSPVVLLLENGDPTRPIIIGFVRDTLPGGQPDATQSFALNGKTLTFEGKDAIALRCGQASLTIRANGDVIIKGTRLMSRASGTNKIRGATVLIN